MGTYELKTRLNDGDVLDFLNSIEHEKRREDGLRLLDIFSEVTQEDPKMWGKSIVGFGTYHYKYESGQEGDWMAVAFSPRKQNLSLYIMPGVERYNELLDKLGKHKIGKSCLYINKLEDVNEKVLREIIRHSYHLMTRKSARS